MSIVEFITRVPRGTMEATYSGTYARGGTATRLWRRLEYRQRIG